MKNIEFLSFRADGSKIELAEVLSAIHDNELVWSMFDFDGQGTPPDKLSWSEFELALSCPQGYMLSWDRLKKFAVTLEDTDFCLLVGARTEQAIINDHTHAQEFSPEYYTSCEIFIYAIDSSMWVVWARDAELMQRMAAVYESQGSGAASRPGSSFVRGPAMPLSMPDDLNE